MMTSVAARPVQFGAVRVVVQTDVFKPLFDYDNAAEPIRGPLLGDLGLYGLDKQKVNQAIRSELGKGPDHQSMQKAAELQKETFVKKLTTDNAANPDYRALLFLIGNQADPTRPEVKFHQSLLIDGPDVERFRKAVFDKAYFTAAQFGPTGVRGADVVKPVANVTDFYPGKLENVFRWVKDSFYKEAVTAYQAGDTTRILSLDA
jgi:hypothetical protein